MFGHFMELVTGATGYIGGRLIDRLLDEGRPVRALARDPGRMALRGPLEVVPGDLVAGTGLEEALAGVEVAYYLVHSMAPAVDGSAAGFADLDRRAAGNFARAARDAGVERVVYLGGLLPPAGCDHPLSEHLSSRLEVERILLDAAPRSTAFRASIVVGARSSSFRLLVRLVERLRLLPFPPWRENSTAPLAEVDAIEYLARAPHTDGAAGESLDIAGPDVLSYGAMIERVADAMGVRRVPIPLPASQTRAASAVVAAVTDQPIELVRPLMQSLETDLLPRDDRAREIFGLRLHSFDRAVEHALREWETDQDLGAR
jgi:uncharacterized protein YbjT (DUF2867 family)